MKKSAMIAVTSMAIMVCSGVSAAPLTDYSVGKTAIDLTVRSSGLTGEYSGTSTSFDKKSNLDFGITTGLGRNFAIQYTDYNAQSNNTTIVHPYSNYTDKTNIKTQELNLLYKINKNISVYTGIIKVNSSDSGYSVDTTGFDSNEYPSSYTADTKSKIQLGLIGNTNIGTKTIAYASFAVASDIINWKIGVSQEIAPNLEFNFDYRNMKINNLSYNGTYTTNNGNDIVAVNDKYTGDITSKGLGYGITYKF